MHFLFGISRLSTISLAAAFAIAVSPLYAQDWSVSDSEDVLQGSVAAFEIEESDLTLSRIAQPDTYFDKTGRRFAILGTESGSFEAWAYPIKLFRDFRFSFFIGSSTTPIPARDIVTRVDVSPAVTTLTYVFQSFTVRAHYVASVDRAGAVIFLDIDSAEPLTIVSGFIPTLTPMWPGGIGGQYAYWDSGNNAYLISESSYGNHGFVGSPAAAGLSYTPAHMLSDQPNEFSIRIENPRSVQNRFVPIVIAGGTGERSDVESIYHELVADPEAVYREARQHFDNLRSSTLRVETPVRELNLALEWAKVAYDNLLVINPHLDGTGLIAGLDRSGSGGRPGFGWFFGGDAYINTLSLNALGYFDASRSAISFMTQFQRDDGKMAHEVSQAVEYVDWFEDYPYAYIHADTSPYFIVAVEDLFQATGDLEFVHAQFPAVERAYAWSRATDGNGDGLMDNSLAGLGALEFGALTGIQSDIYLNAVWIKATEAMAHLSDLMGDDLLAQQARDDHGRARAAFENYWSEDAGQYVYAFNEDGKLVEEITPWAAVGLMFSYGTEERARLSLGRMSKSDLSSDWGVRMLSTESTYFEPLNYNYGAVWPFLTSWVTTADYRRGLPLQGFSGLMSTVQHVYNRSLGQVTEVLSGSRHTWPQESVPHQGFCTAGTVLPLVRGLLGLSTENGATGIALRPSLPGDWDHVQIDNYRIGGHAMSIEILRDDSRIRTIIHSETVGNDAKVAEAFTLNYEPVLAPGTSVRAVRINGRPYPAEIRTTIYLTQPLIQTVIGEGVTIEIDLQPTFEILAPTWYSRVGDASHGLRINAFENDGQHALLVVEGIAGTTYRLGALRVERVRSISGGDVDASDVVITIPDGPAGTYRQQTVEFVLGDS